MLCNNTLGYSRNDFFFEHVQCLFTLCSGHVSHCLWAVHVAIDV